MFFSREEFIFKILVSSKHALKTNILLHTYIHIYIYWHNQQNIRTEHRRREIERERERERKIERKKEIDIYQAEGWQLYGRPASAALVRTCTPASQS